jgi:uncharacterized membrane protein
MNEEQKVNSKLGAALGLGMELVGMVGILIYAGRYFDTKYTWPGYGVAGGGLLAVIVWLVHVIFVIRSIDEVGSSKKPDQE